MDRIASLFGFTKVRSDTAAAAAHGSLSMLPNIKWITFLIGFAEIILLMRMNLLEQRLGKMNKIICAESIRTSSSTKALNEQEGSREAHGTNLVRRSRNPETTGRHLILAGVSFLKGRVEGSF
jgi:hypothetical protein